MHVSQLFMNEKRIAVLVGIASLFDLSGSLSTHRMLQERAEDDSTALASDWRKLGLDARRAMRLENITDIDSQPALF